MKSNVTSHGQSGGVTAGQVTTLQSKVVAFRDGDVEDVASDALGSIVLWDLSGEVDYDDMRNAWESAGLPMSWLVEPTTPRRAMTRAVNELKSKHRFIRRHAGGVVVVDERSVGDDLDFTTSLKIIYESGELRFSPDDHPAIPKVRSAYHRHVGTVLSSDVGRMLCAVADRCDAIPMRAAGGAYFVPAHAVPTWHKVVNVVHDVSECQMHEVPALHCDAAIDAVLRHVSAEAGRNVDEIQEQIASGELGSRALAGRQREAMKLAQKVERYEALLGVSLEGVRENLEKLNAAVTTAAFIAAAREQEDSE